MSVPRRSEPRFDTYDVNSLLVEHSLGLLCVHDFAGRLLSVNGAVAEALGATVEELVGTDLRALLEPSVRDQFDGYLDRIRESGSDRGLMKLRTRSGQPRYWTYRNVLVDGPGEPVILGNALDVTALTRAHSTIRKLVGELLEAQETERRRISRDLHDVLNQRLAVVAIEIGALRQRLPAEGLTDTLGALQAQVEDLSSLVRELSHQLHPATLEHLGLVATLRSYCDEFSQREAIRVRLDVETAPERLPSETAVCLYRVAQEGLRNVARHSGADAAEVRLSGRAHSVRLCVADAGAGFDAEAAKLEGGGLGLVSIEERVRLLDGVVAIESKVGHGTRIVAQLPL